MSPTLNGKSANDKQILFLKKLTESSEKSIIPKLKFDSLLGYYWPLASEIFETNSGEEQKYLEQLANAGCLQRKLFDRVHTCLSCFSFSINFREVCPKCDSPDLKDTPMIHHYRCGCVAPESEFAKGVHFICPKCSYRLKHIGVDYEQSSIGAKCNSCGNVFAEPNVSCRCFNCGEMFDVAKAPRQDIFSYRLTQRGILTAEKGFIESSAVWQAFLDVELNLYTLPFIEELTQQEILRSRRTKGSFCLMLISIDLSQISLFRDIAKIIKGVLRDSDVPGLFSDNTLICMLRDTNLAGSLIVGNRILDQIRKMSTETLPKVSIGLSVFSSTAANAKQMIDTAGINLLQAHRAGGNCIFPKGE